MKENDFCLISENFYSKIVLIMDKSKEGFSQVAITLIDHYDCVYYVDINTGNYTNLVYMKEMERIGVPFYGDDFFSDLRKCTERVIHPNDLDNFKLTFDKELTKEQISDRKSFSVIYRVLIGGKPVHLRHSVFRCHDREHILCCLENIEEEFQKNEVLKKKIESAKRMARFDELTGVRNKNAFKEFSEFINRSLKEKKDYRFGIIMCDMNDLKIINDTRGHNVGDESIQRTSRMICDIFVHSPVFRIGGDEFVIILTGNDYNNRESLIENLKEESFLNKRTRSGPVVACGMAVYEPNTDDDFTKVFERADKAMYENKKEVKSMNLKQTFRNMDNIEKQISPERKRSLDALFGALCTVSDNGYVYLNDMRYDFSRWSLPFVDDFGMKSEYMYHADKLWQKKIHPDDLEAYRNAVDAILCGTADMLEPLTYRALKADGTYALLTTRGFILSDDKGNADYFGGIVIPM